jgi:hypothetical protein
MEYQLGAPEGCPVPSPLVAPVVLIWMFIVFNATFNNISVLSWWSALLVEESGVPGKNHRPTTRY